MLRVNATVIVCLMFAAAVGFLDPSFLRSGEISADVRFDVVVEPARSTLAPCADMTVTDFPVPDVPFGDMTSSYTSSGEPLSGEQAGAVQAAVEMIQNWENDCGVTPDNPGGAGSPKASDTISGLLASGDICAEAVTGMQDEAAAWTAPRPQDVPPTDPDGRTAVGSGYPGVNLNPGRIPKPVAGGGFPASSGGSYHEGLMGLFAGVLLHEMSHHMNPLPRHALFDSCDVENPAFTYSSEQLCKVAGCGNKVSQFEKEAACALIMDSNFTTCLCSGTQNDCAACAVLGMSTKLEPCGGGTSPYPPPSWTAELGRRKKLYSAGGYVGTIHLDPDDKSLFVFLFYGANGMINQTFDIAQLYTSSFQPLSLDLLQPSGATSLYLAGYDEQTLVGEIVRVDLDFTITPPLAFSQVYSGTDFLFPTSIVAFEDNPNQVIIPNYSPYST